MLTERGQTVEIPRDTTDIARNAASIAAVPWEQLADGPARCLLLEMAYAGLDASAYPDREGRWRIRLQARDMTCAEWAAKFVV